MRIQYLNNMGTSTILILILSGLLVTTHLLSRGSEKREQQRQREREAFQREYWERHISKKK